METVRALKATDQERRGINEEENPKEMTESAPMRITTRFGTRFATRFAPLNSKQSCGERLEVPSNPLTGRTFVIGLRKQRLLPLGNLVPNLVDHNTLNISPFYSESCSKNRKLTDCSTD